MSLPLYNLSGAKVSDVSEVKDCEYGSNANGEYWKYANGLIIQFVNKIITSPCTSAYGGYYTTGLLSVGIPYNLKTCLYTNASFKSKGATIIATPQIELGIMQLTFLIANGTSWSDCTGTISAIIVGTWK